MRYARRFVRKYTRLVLHAVEERHVGRCAPAREEAPQGDGVDDRAREQVRARLRALVQHGDRHLAEPLGEGRRLLDELAQPDRAREPGRAGADDEHSDLDPLVGWIGRLGDRLGRRNRRSVVGRLDHGRL